MMHIWAYNKILCYNLEKKKEKGKLKLVTDLMLQDVTTRNHEKKGECNCNIYHGIFS